CRKEDRAEARIVRKEKILIHDPNQLVAGAALITSRGNQVVAQFVLSFQRIGVDVRVRQILWRAPEFDRTSNDRTVWSYSLGQCRIPGKAANRVGGAGHVENCAVRKWRPKISLRRTATQATTCKE